ncbi:MAG: hypothetical protein Fur0022_27240 [Anaerolineales bacterium]
MDKFAAIFEQTDDWWIAYAEELPGANTQSKTLDEARENLNEAIQLIIKANSQYLISNLPPPTFRSPP